MEEEESAVRCESRDMQSEAVLTSSININPHISDIPVSGPQWPAPSCCGPSCCRPPSRPSPRCPARTPGQGPCWLYPFLVNILTVKISYGCFDWTFKKFPNWKLKWKRVFTLQKSTIALFRNASSIHHYHYQTQVTATLFLLSRFRLIQQRGWVGNWRVRNVGASVHSVQAGQLCPDCLAPCSVVLCAPRGDNAILCHNANVYCWLPILCPFSHYLTIHISICAAACKSPKTSNKKYLHNNSFETLENHLTTSDLHILTTVHLPRGSIQWMEHNNFLVNYLIS